MLGEKSGSGNSGIKHSMLLVVRPDVGNQHISPAYYLVPANCQ